MELLRKVICYVPTLRFPQFQGEWQYYSFYQCVSIPNGMVDPTDFKYCNLPHIGAANIEKSTGQLLAYNTAQDDALISGKYLFSENDVIYSKVRPYFAKAALPRFVGLCSADAYPLQPNMDVITPYFLLQSVLHPKFTKFTSSISKRTGMPKVNRDNLSFYKFCVPSLEEQSRINTFLHLIDNRISVQNKIIEDLKILKKELMDYILNSCDFVELTIQELINTGYARIIKASELKKFDGTREYLSTSSIGGNGIEQIESIITYTHRPSRAAMFPIKGSIWFAKMKNTVKVYQSSADDENRYILSTGFYGLLCNENKVNPYWLLELFKSDYFNTQKDRFSEGSSMSGIKDKQLMDIKLKVFTNRNKEAFHTSNIQALSQKITLEKTILKKLLKQKQFYLNALFI